KCHCRMSPFSLALQAVPVHGVQDIADAQVLAQGMAVRLDPPGMAAGDTAAIVNDDAPASDPLLPNAELIRLGRSIRGGFRIARHQERESLDQHSGLLRNAVGFTSHKPIGIRRWDAMRNACDTLFEPRRL